MKGKISPMPHKKKSSGMYGAFVVGVCLCFLTVLVFGYYIVDKNVKSIGRFLEQERLFSFFTNDKTAHITVFNENFEIPLPTLTD